MLTPRYTHLCAKGGPATLPVTWDRIAGGARVSCPLCGVSRLAASVSGTAV